MEPLIEVNGLWKRYSKDLNASIKYAAKDIFKGMVGNNEQSALRETEFWALQNVSFSLQRGDVLAVLGHNGAGKSTLLKCIASKLSIDKGDITLRGNLSHLIELSAGFVPRMSGRENITIRGKLLGMQGKTLENFIDKVKDFSELDEFFDAPLQFYSSGMRSRLGFAASSSIEADILILDEVLAVGDLGFRLKCYERVNELAKKSAVIFVSHSIGQVARICNKGIYLEKGQLKYSGDVQEAIHLYQENQGVVLSKNKLHLLNEDLIQFELLHVNQKLQDNSELPYGAELSVKINISKLPSNAQIRIILKDGSQAALMDWNSARLSLDWPEDPQFMMFELGKQELAPGYYGLFIQVMSPDGTQHLVMSESKRFRVIGKLYYTLAVQKTAQSYFVND